MTLSDRIRAALPHMSQADRDILKSMRDRAKAGPYQGVLSLKQLAFVEVILARSVPGRAPVANLTRINEMFDTAAKSLKAPRVHFLVGERELTLTPAGATSKNSGYLYVQADKGRYCGKISPEGVFYPIREAVEGIRETLETFAADPRKAAQAFGQATGRCCLCNRKLTDPKSVAAGVGPICVNRFGI
jgi:hypothetical protein